MGAVLAAAMLANTVTAADVCFSYKGSNYFSGNDIKYLDRTNCMSMSLTSDVGGVVVDFDTGMSRQTTARTSESVRWR